MTNRQITSKLIKKLNISDILYNKALIFSEFVTNKYATEVYNKFLDGKLTAEQALYEITTVEV